MNSGSLKAAVEFDLHNHTDRSPDAKISGRRLIDFARRKGLKGLGICDHDTFPDTSLFEYAASRRIKLAQGIEFTCRDAHIIGYNLAFSRERQSWLADWFAQLEDNRSKVAREIIHGLEKMGLGINWKSMTAYAAKMPHKMYVLKYLVEELRAFPNLATARSWLQAEGLDLPDDHGLEPLNPVDAVDIIHEAKGTAIWSHPLHTPEPQRSSMLAELYDAGLDGVEVVYAYRENGHPGPESNAVLEARMLAALSGMDIAISGGSGSHFPVRCDAFQRPLLPGDAGITSYDMERLMGIFPKP